MNINFSQARKSRNIVSMENEPGLPPADRQIYRGMATVFGAGDELRGFVLLNALAIRLEQHRMDNPRYAGGAGHALDIMGAAYHELEDVIEHGKPDTLQYEKAMNLASAVLRFLASEHRVNDND